MKHISLILTCCFVLVSCTSNEEKRKKDVGYWKYVDGHHYGDCLIFDENTSLRNDTIFQNQKPFALLVKFKENSIANHKILVLRNLESKKLSRYVGK